jgi:hypothetical protein
MDKVRTVSVIVLIASAVFSSSCAGPKIQLTGDDFSAWRDNTGEWEIVGDAFMNPENKKLLSTRTGTGVMINGPIGKAVHLFSKKCFGDVMAHIEFMVPEKSNSGVYFMGRYEIQVLDSWGKKNIDSYDCGGIYERWDESRTPKGYEGRAPAVNVSLPPGHWQSFDAVFRAPRFDRNGKKIRNACFEKVVHNGTVIHKNIELTGPTRAAAFDCEADKGPLMLQGEHGPVAYRNIWLMELP